MAASFYSREQVQTLRRPWKTCWFRRAMPGDRDPSRSPVWGRWRRLLRWFVGQSGLGTPASPQTPTDCLKVYWPD